MTLILGSAVGPPSIDWYVPKLPKWRLPGLVGGQRWFEPWTEASQRGFRQVYVDQS